MIRMNGWEKRDGESLRDGWLHWMIRMIRFAKDGWMSSFGTDDCLKAGIPSESGMIRMNGWEKRDGESLRDG